MEHFSGSFYDIYFDLIFSGYGVINLIHLYVYDNDIDGRKQINYANSFSLSLEYFLWHLYWFNSSVEVLGFGVIDLINL